MRQSKLVNKQMKRGIIVSIHSIRLNSNATSIRFNSIKFSSIQFKICRKSTFMHSKLSLCFQIYSFLESDVLWELYNKTETRTPQQKVVSVAAKTTKNTASMTREHKFLNGNQGDLCVEEFR